MKVLLLGVTGLLGHHVLQQLLNRGHEVVAIVRSPHKLLITHANLEVVEANLSLESIKKEAQRCEAIINCAGTTDMSLLSVEDYYPINRDLCGILATTLQELPHVKSLVHVSTANTIGYGAKGHLATESSPMQFPFTRSFYAISKSEGEVLLQQWAKSHPDRHIVIVNPGFMVGSYDVKPSSGTLLLSGYKKRIMVAPGGGKSFVHVADVAHAVVNALIFGQSGARYLATGENLSIRDFYALQARIMGYKQYLITLPNGVVRFAGRIGDIFRAMGIKMQLALRNVNQLLVMEYYDATLAKQDLQMPTTPIEVAIKDFFEYYHQSTKSN